MKSIATLFCSCLLLLQACTYAISPDMVSRADKSVTFKMLQDNPEAFKGKILILGGTIGETVPAKEGTTMEIVQKPLDFWGRPKRTDRSGGRFILRSSRRLDPLVYEPGRQITVAAEVEGARDRVPDDVSSSGSLVVHALELKLWERDRQTWAKPQWTDPLYDPSSSSGRHDW